MLPSTLILVAILVILSSTMAVQTMLLVKSDHQYASTALLSVSADNATEMLRRGFAMQIANHVEVDDVQIPQLAQTQADLCDEKKPTCEVVLSQAAEFLNQQVVGTPSPVDTPVPCDGFYGSNLSNTQQCNLSVGGELEESRRTVRLRVTIQNKQGRSLGSVSREVRLRLFRLFPYAQIVGVRTVLNSNSVESVADVAGFDSVEGVKHDTLLRSYSKCINLPKTVPTPRSDEFYGWKNWHSDKGGPPPILYIKCLDMTGDSSHYENGSVIEDEARNGWGERM